MGVPHSSFIDSDVYIDFPYEEVMFRFEKRTGRVFRKFYGELVEEAIPHDNKLFAEARSAGTETTLDTYQRGRPRRSQP